MSGKKAPGPRGYPIVGSLPAFRRDVLGLMLESSLKFGDIVRYRLGPFVIHQLNHPEHIKYVLKDNERYDKQTFTSKMIRGITGLSLLTSDGDYWKTQRTLMQPAFAKGQMKSLVSSMVGATEEMLSRWRTAPVDSSIDISSEMMRLTYTIVERTLFGSRPGQELPEIEAAMFTILEHTYARLQNGGILPQWLPLRSNRAFHAAISALERRVDQIVAAHRETADPRDTLLARLLDARDTESGASMNDRMLRNEAITLLSAGHETTANALTWFWYLLSKHPAAADRVEAEVRQTLKEGDFNFETLERLEYTRCCLMESLRLYPPIWAIVRRAVEEDEIGGFQIRKNSRIVISTHTVHRLPGLWDDPEAFRPERFERSASATRHHYSYLPFGGGPRVCIGQHFAMIEALIIIALVIREYRLRITPGFEPLVDPGITLRSKNGLSMLRHAA